MPKNNQQFTHIERSHYKVPLTDNVNEQQLMTDAPINASVDALQAAMLKYGLPVLGEAQQQPQQQEEPQKPNIFGDLIKSAINQ
jgi:hypothetical protein